MAKFQIIIEDNEDLGGVNVSLQGTNSDTSNAGRLALAMMEQARLISRIPVPKSLHVGCDCEGCAAMREKIATNPTIH